MTEILATYEVAEEIIRLDRDAELKGTKVRDMPYRELVSYFKEFRQMGGSTAEAWAEVIAREVERRL